MFVRKRIGPCDPHPLEALVHSAPSAARKGIVELRAGYSFADASALLGVPSNELRPLANCFALWGRRANDSLYRPINPLNWLETRDARASEIIDKSDGVNWFDVRFIPPICAPNVHEFLDGLEFHVAFWRVILSDPEVGIAYNAALSSAPCLGRFVRLRRLFGPDEMLRISESAFLIMRCSRHLHDVCADVEKKKISLGRYPDLIAGRTRQLLGLLSTSRIQADGFWRSDTRQRIAIDPTLWARSEYAIDLRKGDLVNVETGEKEWRSIVLRAPRIDLDDIDEKPGVVAAPASARRGRKPSPHWDAIKEKCFELMNEHGDFSADDEWNAQARLEEELKMFCSTKFGWEPGDSTLRGKLPSWREEWLSQKLKT